LSTGPDFVRRAARYTLKNLTFRGETNIISPILKKFGVNIFFLNHIGDTVGYR
jgi:hypothetical protein